MIDAVLVPEAGEVPVTPPSEESTETTVPGLPTTGIGPDSSSPWLAVVLASLALGLAYVARRRNAFAAK